jgi:hypothetical protein
MGWALLMCPSFLQGMEVLCFKKCIGDALSLVFPFCKLLARLILLKIILNTTHLSAGMMKRCFPQQILTLHYLYSFSGPFKKG